MPGEFELIQRYFDRPGLNDQCAAVSLGIGDDCAIIDVPVGLQLCFSIDTLVAGVHFPVTADAELLARRALAVNLSDLAAMGATPICFTLALSLPEADSKWLHGFSTGLEQVARVFEISLAGGDTTRGPLSITIQVQGLLPVKRALRRDGAGIGDLILVSGTLGDAAAALTLLDQDYATLDDCQQYLWQRYYDPQPRIALGRALLAGGGRCAIDISDGLLADLGHILERSGVGAVVDLAALPCSSALQSELLRKGQPNDASKLALGGGDDYELCFTLPEPLWQSMKAELCALVPCTPIGRIQSAAGILTTTGEPLSATGYQHF